MFDKDDRPGKIVERSSSPQTEGVVQDTSMDEDDFAFDGDLDLLEAELGLDPLSSDGLNKMDMDTTEEIEIKQEVSKESGSDDLFDDVTFDDLAPEELEALDQSSNAMAMTAPMVTNEDDALFGDGYDEFMDLDFDDTQPEVFVIHNSA